ncbi:phosphodiester glycosidase family protein [Aestuariimicrobium kwangyangense]|uniref:phosphodiester glycosidase family protein n=1 Tax=Aestuariimicrobium kwangyangense TaxID=396389 RepID=UPI0003B6E54A|nr:phosphodiester glycosidase family protein [Aestuariimicrobium kwangyangense]
MKTHPPQPKSPRIVVLALAAALASASLPIATPAHAAPSLPGSQATVQAVHSGGSTLVVDRTTAIAPGLDLTSFRRLQPGGWVTGHVMDADLSTPSLGVDVADGGTVSGSNATIESLGRQARAVAAVNGDYFDMNATDAPVGTNVSSAGVRTISSSGRPSFTVSNGRAAVQALMSTATIASGDITERLTAVNSPGVAADQATLFTQVWGGYSLEGLVPVGETNLRVVRIAGGVVTASSSERSSLALSSPIAAGESVVVARGAAASRLAVVQVGSVVEVSVGTSSPVDVAVGGSQWMIREGVVNPVDEATAGRTAIGVSKDGTRLKVVTIDGRAGDSHGMAIAELSAFMRDLGVWNALNLDGGGSTTLVARAAGTSDLQLVNRPSDGNQRLDANALVFTSTAGGPVGGVAVRPALQPAAGLERPEATRLLPGLSRTMAVTGLDANLAATPVEGKLVTKNTAVATVENTKPTGATGVVRALTSGETQVEYFAKLSRTGAPARDDLTLHVDGALARIEPSRRVVALSDTTDSVDLTVTAVDYDGNRVPVETRDIAVDAGPGIMVRSRDLETLAVSATGSTKASKVVLTVLGRSVTVPVTVGVDEVPLADFSSVADWKVGLARATGSLSPATGPQGGPALGMDLDFTTSTATRGMYAVPVTPIAVGGQPQAVTMWINGTGKGEWPRLQVTRGDGTSTNLDAPLITWSGWRKVTFPVPAGTPFPLTVTAIRFMETRSTATYTDHLEIADLVAEVPVSVDLAPIPVAADQVIITQGTVDQRPLRIAVMSDTQFVARNGADGPVVQAARRTLREIVAARPDLLLVVGDFVDEGGMADLQLARTVLDEEATGKVPWTYVPGNHEVMGAPISNFESVFGPTSTHRVVQGTLIVTLDSSSGTLHPGGSTEQLRMLEQQLAHASTDPTVTGVLVVNHHPVDDFQPDQASRLTDRYEASALAAELAAWHRSTGKQVAQVNGHIGSFHADARDGVSRIVNGNSGKSPSGSPDRGGFTGWTMLGIDPSSTGRLGWLQAETRARVDQLAMEAPARLSVGGSASVSATLTQDGGRQVPVAWPVSATWSGDGVALRGRDTSAAVVEFDPATRTVRGLRPGTATLEVTVNGVRAVQTITV